MSGPGAAPRKSDSAPWPRRTLSKLQRVVNDLTPKSRQNVGGVFTQMTLAVTRPGFRHAWTTLLG